MQEFDEDAEYQALMWSRLVRVSPDDQGDFVTAESEVIVVNASDDKRRSLLGSERADSRTSSLRDDDD